eukprot:30834-Pelagococcus_subviridis.AAC.6
MSATIDSATRNPAALAFSMPPATPPAGHVATPGHVATASSSHVYHPCENTPSMAPNVAYRRSLRASHVASAGADGEGSTSAGARVSTEDAATLRSEDCAMRSETM